MKTVEKGKGSVAESLHGPMGMRWFRGGAREVDKLRTTDPTMLFPMEKTVLNVHGLGGSSEPALLHEGLFALCPAQRALKLELESPAVQLLWLELRPEARKITEATYRPDIERKRLEDFLLRPRVLKRTVWVHELACRYLFERMVCEKHQSVAARFLEQELVKELYFLIKEADAQHERTSLVEKHSELISRALQEIESRLFEDDSVAALAKRLRVSASTLLRAFKAEVGSSPSDYVRLRRLDEALMLLQRGRYSVAETAFEVGYANAAAFTHAFHERFGIRPSEVQRARGAMDRPAPARPR